MAKMTLLELVQNILSDLNSDEVTSISDTVEAYQVATVVKSTYFDLLADDKLIPEHFSLGQLTALGSLTLPNYMQLPTTCKTVEWIKYDTHTASDTRINYVNVKYKSPQDFLNMILSNDSTATNITTINDTSGVKLLIRNDKFPEYYTSFDDDYLVFDSYMYTTETSLTAARSSIWCSYEPTFTLSDSYIPDLDSNLFPLLLAEAKSLCFVNNTQSTNVKVEQIAKRHQNHKQGSRHRIEAASTNNYPDYGRKR